MRVYVATKFENRDEAAALMRELEREGHTIAYDWTANEQVTAAQARADVDGVLTADVLVVLATQPAAYKGTYVEIGIAIARGIPIYLVGDAMDACIFTRLPQVRRNCLWELFD